jgi:hypothetical protein
MSARSFLLAAALLVTAAYVLTDHGSESTRLPPSSAAQSALLAQTESAKGVERPQGDRTNRELSAAEIAARIVRESRNAYYATGHPCACPDDLMRNGRRCGGNSAYSRPGGAEPLCYVTDVSSEMIARYRARFR